MHGLSAPAPDALGLGVDAHWPWWQDDAACSQHLLDLIGNELQALRPGWHWPAPPPQCLPLHLHHDLGVDSLELMSLSAALAQACGLHDPAAHTALYADQHLSAWADVARQAWAARPAHIGFRTSGSTGRPRAVPHRTDALQQEMGAVGTELLTGPYGAGLCRVVSVVRSHHIYGHLFTLLLPHWPGWRARTDVPLPVWHAAGLPPAAVLSQLRPGDVLVGFPDWWHAALRCGITPPAGVVGITSTAPCPAELALAWREAGLSRLLHVYGSTETAGIGWRDDPQQPYTLMPHWQPVVAPAGLDGAAHPAVDALQRHWPTGECSRVPLPDHVRWLGPRALLPQGRVDQAVQVGGVNVQPQAVCDHLLRHPEVADAAVRLHDFDGVPRLKAWVVPRRSDADAATLRAQLAAHLARLPPPARPAHLSVGPSLPRNAMGKLTDWPLPAN